MKATGIVRRIDELGRVVIPKEIRRTLRIKDGDPLEIFTDRDELMLKKYSPIATLERFSEGTTRSLNDLSGYLAVICDTDEVLYAAGEGRKEFAKSTFPKSSAASCATGAAMSPTFRKGTASFPSPKTPPRR